MMLCIDASNQITRNLCNESAWRKRAQSQVECARKMIRTSLRSAVIPLTNCLVLPESVPNAPLNWYDGTARLTGSSRPVSFKKTG